MWAHDGIFGSFAWKREEEKEEEENRQTWAQDDALFLVRTSSQWSQFINIHIVIGNSSEIAAECQRKQLEIRNEHKTSEQMPFAVHGIERWMLPNILYRKTFFAAERIGSFGWGTEQ